MQNKHDPAKQLKKAGTTGQESTVFILLEENEQSEPIRTLPLNQEVVKRKNQRARGHSTLLAYIVQAKQDYNKQKEVKKMELSKKADEHIKYPALEGKEDLRFELFDWLKEKNLTVRQAINLLDMTKNEIVNARRTVMDNMVL